MRVESRSAGQPPFSLQTHHHSLLMYRYETFLRNLLLQFLGVSLALQRIIPGRKISRLCFLFIKSFADSFLPSLLHFCKTAGFAQDNLLLIWQLVYSLRMWQSIGRERER